MDRTAIKSFVRETLGCGCEDEVFERIERRDTGAGVCGTLELGIGGRLLVSARVSADSEVLMHDLGAWLAAGLRRRAEGGYHRLRLVLGCDDPGSIAPAAQAAFDRLSKPDERVHLHVIGRAAVEALMRG